MSTARVILSAVGVIFFLVLLILACLPSAAVRKLAKRIFGNK